MIHLPCVLLYLWMKLVLYLSNCKVFKGSTMNLNDFLMNIDMKWESENAMGCSCHWERCVREDVRVLRVQSYTTFSFTSLMIFSLNFKLENIECQNCTHLIVRWLDLLYDKGSCWISVVYIVTICHVSSNYRRSFSRTISQAWFDKHSKTTKDMSVLTFKYFKEKISLSFEF